MSGDTFATSETSIGEAGCIHTSQGLEFDYVGVDDIINSKMDQNEAKYPVEKAKGVATKYDKL